MGSEQEENQEQNQEQNQEKQFNVKTTAISVFKGLLNLLICLLGALFITSVLIVNAKVPTSSMEPTIMAGDFVFGNRLSYLNSSPDRYDVVIFRAPDEPKTLYVKRVIGIPGDKIEIVDGALYLNDELLDEPYIKEPMYGSYGTYYVPENSYFMLGDNRNSSKDARYWENTYVSEDAILGKAIFTYFPEIRKIE